MVLEKTVKDCATDRSTRTDLYSDVECWWIVYTDVMVNSTYDESRNEE